MASFMLGSLHSPSPGTYDVTVRSQPPRQPEGSQVIWLPLRLWQEHSARDHRGRSGRWRTLAVHAHGKYDKPRERLPFLTTARLFVERAIAFAPSTSTTAHCAVICTVAQNTAPGSTMPPSPSSSRFNGHSDLGTQR